MRVALAAIADDGDFLALDQIDVGIPVVIDAHFFHPRRSVRLAGLPRQKARFGAGLLWQGQVPFRRVPRPRIALNVRRTATNESSGSLSMKVNNRARRSIVLT